MRNRCGMGIAALLFIAAAVCFSPARAEAQSSGRTYKYVLWIADNEKGKNQVNEFTKQIVGLMFKQMNEKVQFVEMTRSEMLKAVRTKNVDFTFLWQSDYLDLLDEGVKLTPVLTTAVRKHMSDYMCVVTAKNVDYTGLESLRGKKAVFPLNKWDYVATRWYLASKKIDVPLDKFFGSFNRTPYDSASTLKELAEGRAEATIINQQPLNFLKFANPAVLKQLNSKDCSDWPWPSSPVVAVGGNIPPDVQKKFYDTLSTLETLPDFKRLKPTINLIQIQMNLVSEKDFAGMRKVFADAKKKGWVAEYTKLGGKK